MFGYPRKLLGNISGRQHKIDRTRCNCAAGHTIVLRRAVVLGESNASFAFDGFNSQSPVATGTGKNNPTSPALLLLRE